MSREALVSGETGGVVDWGHRRLPGVKQYLARDRAAVDRTVQWEAHEVENLTIRARVPILAGVRDVFGRRNAVEKFSAERGGNERVGLPDAVEDLCLCAQAVSHEWLSRLHPGNADTHFNTSLCVVQDRVIRKLVEHIFDLVLRERDVAYVHGRTDGLGLLACSDFQVCLFVPPVWLRAQNGGQCTHTFIDLGVRCTSYELEDDGTDI
jgi:hypothetical protein